MPGTDKSSPAQRAKVIASAMARPSVLAAICHFLPVSDLPRAACVDRQFRLAATLRGHMAKINALAAEGGCLVSGDGAGRLRRWQLEAT